MKKKILFFDIEGGHGGSSKSLYYTLSNISPKKFNITVVCKRKSWLESEYKKKNIKCFIFDEMPCFSSLKNFFNNIILLIKFTLIIWPNFLINKSKYITLINKNEIIHLNQISLVFFGLWIKKNFPNKTITMHIRTLPYYNFFSWLKIFISTKICKKFIFITKYEKLYMEKILNKKIEGSVISNLGPEWKTIKNNKNKIINLASLSNYSYERGTDRVIDIFYKIPKKYKNNFFVHILGDYKIKNNLKNFFNKKNNLKKYAEKLKVSKNIKFYGHHKYPEKILKKCQYLIKLTREENPWGRDIIEAISLGLGIISIGTKSPWIKNNSNGYLFKKYDPTLIAKKITNLSKTKSLISKHQSNSKKIYIKKLNTKKITQMFEKFWFNLK
jgi:glycosyltransferase involved in cell wall biosynthesis